MRLTLIILCALGLSACVTQKRPHRPYQKRAYNFEELQKLLGLNRPNSELGFREQGFNSCQFGSPPCRSQFLTTIHLQILCRSTTGTVQSLSPHDLRTLGRRAPIQWTMGSAQGQIELDQRGFGQLRLISPRSAHRKKLKLRYQNEALRMEARSAAKIVVPANWCRQ